MARVGSIAYQVSNIAKAINGIGQSKLESRNESGIRSAESGHKVSDKVHSVKSMENLRDDLKNLAEFAKAEHGIKDMSKIDINVVKEWIQSKDITYNTASNYLSEMNKVSEHLNFTREEVKDLRSELKQELSNIPKETRAYKDLDKVQVHDRSAPAFELQRDYGLRVSAATKIDIEKQLEGNILSYAEKGGKLSSKEISHSLAQKIRENAVQGKYELNNRTYARDVKSAIESQTKNSWNGTHGIRHAYAQTKLENGMSKSEVSQEMGHVREEITNTYLR